MQTCCRLKAQLRSSSGLKQTPCPQVDRHSPSPIDPKWKEKGTKGKIQALTHTCPPVIPQRLHQSDAWNQHWVSASVDSHRFPLQPLSVLCWETAHRPTAHVFLCAEVTVWVWWGQAVGKPRSDLTGLQNALSVSPSLSSYDPVSVYTSVMLVTPGLVFSPLVVNCQRNNVSFQHLIMTSSVGSTALLHSAASVCRNKTGLINLKKNKTPPVVPSRIIEVTVDVSVLVFVVAALYQTVSFHQARVSRRDRAMSDWWAGVESVTCVMSSDFGCGCFCVRWHLTFVFLLLVGTS